MNKLFAVLAGLLLSVLISTTAVAEDVPAASLPNTFTGSWYDETNPNWGLVIDASELVTTIYWYTYNLSSSEPGQMWFATDRSWDRGDYQEFRMVTPVADSQSTAGTTRVDVGTAYVELSFYRTTGGNVDMDHLSFTWRLYDIGICARNLPVATPECQETTVTLTRLTHPVD